MNRYSCDEVHAPLKIPPLHWTVSTVEWADTSSTCCL